MKIFNLIDPETSDIEFKISQFPDGQQDITILGWPAHLDVEWETSIYTLIVQIYSRFNSFRDLELIVCAAKALRRLGVKEISLYIPYLLGSRSDRQFQLGGTSYLVDVVAPIINSLNFERVIVMDVHSDVASACINNLIIKDNTKLIIYSINKMYDVKGGWIDSNPLKNVVLISPDAGALKKIYNVAKAIDYKGDIVVASKHRELDGTITKTDVPITFDIHGGKDFIIIDDICDGGRTFINIAKGIRDKTSAGKIFLIVTHGIFSAGLKELSGYFDGIYTTNSIMDIDSMNEFGMRNEKYLDKIHQLEIF